MKQKKFLLFLSSVTLLFAFIVLWLSSQNSFFNIGCPCSDPQLQTGNFEKQETEAFFDNQKVNAPLKALADLSLANQKVLGENNGDQKWIEVDLSEQKLRAWDGNTLYLESLVSTGSTFPTPTGEFRIWAKFKYTKMSGGSKENNTYYYLPNVPYTMYFYKGFGLHGTYWHSNFGHRMSHGCVNLPTPVAEKLFYWTNPSMGNKNSIVIAANNKDNLGTRVIIHN